MGGELEVPAEQTHEGVKIHRVDIPGFGRGRDSQAGRAADYAIFHLRAALATLLQERPDLVVSLTTPSMLPVTVRAACAARGVPYGIWAMDLHPDIEDRLDLLPEVDPLVDALHAASRWGYRGAEFVVALGPHVERRIRRLKGVSSSATVEIPVWSRKDEVYPVPPEQNPLRRELGLEDAFVVMYSGNAGLGHRFEEILEAAERLEGENVAFLFVGGGPRRPEIEAEADERGLTNFQYRDYVPRERLAHSLSVGDLHLVTLRPEMSGLAAPGKLYGIMAAGRPALFVGPAASDPGAVVSGHGVGVVVDPRRENDPANRVAQHIRSFRDDDERRRETGERAREVFLERYERAICCREWDRLLGDLVLS